MPQRNPYHLHEFSPGLAVTNSDNERQRHPIPITNQSTHVPLPDHPPPIEGSTMNEIRDAHQCTDCGGGPAHKPIAHQDSLDDPVGHLCLICYSGWVQLTDFEEECVICGEDAEYYTVRELSDYEGNAILTTGKIGACEEHVLECADVPISPPKKLQ